MRVTIFGTVCVTIFSTGRKFRPVSIVVTRSYSSRPFLCALDDIDAQFKTTMKEGGHDSYSWCTPTEWLHEQKLHKS